MTAATPASPDAGVAAVPFVCLQWTAGRAHAAGLFTVCFPGDPGTLRVAGTFHQGGAQINWQQNGHVLAIWDFTIETD
ncbi:MAG TPA: hypothetical protein VEO01_23210 [Pseudonocardiaceae bacterium]|nr:hypothetical protein [Pseudonocardiaceae bacterium]